MPSELSLLDRLRGKRTTDIALPTETEEGLERDYQRGVRSRNPLTKLRAVARKGSRTTKRAAQRR